VEDYKDMYVLIIKIKKMKELSFAVIEKLEELRNICEARNVGNYYPAVWNFDVQFFIDRYNIRVPDDKPS